MRTLQASLKLIGALILTLGALTGCESPSGGGSDVENNYYGAGFHDPYYYGGYSDHADIIVTPPPFRPESPGRPEQPIYRPSGPRPTPMPSIPSAPRPMPRPAMRR